MSDLIIGLVNNMPPGAFRAAEAQFAGLLHKAAALSGLRVQLNTFATHPEMEGRCDGLDTLWHQRLDGMIVTGVHPMAGDIANEPGWPDLSRLVDWAAAHTDATIWSCLAAHAAVFHLDGVTRRRLPHKLSGVFRCEPATDSGLMAGAPARWSVPHSRHNDVDRHDLEQAGYRILSYGPGEAGQSADSFEKVAGRSRFLMLQGHPEYAADTLMREYRRDVRQFVTGMGDAPQPPSGYFDVYTMGRLAELRARMIQQPGPAILEALDTILDRPPPARWHVSAVWLWQRWLAQFTAEPGDRALSRELATT